STRMDSVNRCTLHLQSLRVEFLFAAKAISTASLNDKRRSSTQEQEESSWLKLLLTAPALITTSPSRRTHKSYSDRECTSDRRQSLDASRSEVNPVESETDPSPRNQLVLLGSNQPR